MRLTYSDIKEIEEIISKFTEDDHERIYAEVEWEDRQMKSNPLTNAMRGICGSSQAFELASDTSKWQEQAHKAWWDMTTMKHQYEYALAIYTKRHETQEAA